MSARPLGAALGPCHGFPVSVAVIVTELEEATASREQTEHDKGFRHVSHSERKNSFAVGRNCHTCSPVRLFTQLFGDEESVCVWVCE